MVANGVQVYSPTAEELETFKVAQEPVMEYLKKNLSDPTLVDSLFSAIETAETMEDGGLTASGGGSPDRGGRQPAGHAEPGCHRGDHGGADGRGFSSAPAGRATGWRSELLGIRAKQDRPCRDGKQRKRRKS